MKAVLDLPWAGRLISHSFIFVSTIIVALILVPNCFAAQVTLAWDRNTEPDVAGYKVYYGSSSRNYRYSVDVGNYASCTISDLSESETYYFAATAYDSNNIESNLSEELTYKIPDEDSRGGDFGNTSTTVIEAEEMSYHANGAQKGDYWLLWSNGTMNEDVDFPAAGTYHFEITAKGDLANAVGPRMELLIDGQSKAGVLVNTSTSAVFTFKVEVPAGMHEIAIGFNNDYYDPSKGLDRNLYVDEMTIFLPGNVTPRVIEAEEMSYHANGAQKGDYWLLWSNGTMNEDVDFPAAGIYHFEITAKGDLANGVGPRMELLIDGQGKGNVLVNTSTSALFTFKVEVPAGVHEVAVGFNNDYYDPSKKIDRNLSVDKMTISYHLQ